MTPSGHKPLENIKVVDAASLFAGPVIASFLGDYGAEVTKIEHPSGDNLRGLGWSKDGVSLWWAFVGRNKRSVTCKLSDPDGRDLLKEILKDKDVLIENFRPGTLEKWGLGPDVLHELNPGLVIVRVTGFGQTVPDKPPALPPFALGDGVAALTGVATVMMALWWREHGGNGKGQVIDLSIYEPLFWLLGPQALVYDQLGLVQERTGNAAPFTAPRNAYQASDGKWLGMSASAQSIAERVMQIIGHEELIAEPWFKDHTGRLEHAEELDALIQEWIGQRTCEEVLAGFATGQGAIAPIYSIADIFEDPQYAARETITTIQHPVLGPLKMPNVIPRMSDTPGKIEHAGPDLGNANEQVYEHELGISKERVAALRAKGVI